MSQDEFSEIMILKTIFCKSCNKLVAMQQGVCICLDESELIARAKDAHRNVKDINNPNALPCINPKLIIEFGTALISNDLILELQGVKP